MEVNIKQAETHIIQCMQAGLPCMLAGSPGTGKSMLGYQIAEKFKLFPIDIRLSQCDPVDLNN